MSLLFQKIMKFNSLSILLKQGNCWLHKYACVIGVCSRAPFLCSFQSTDPMWGNEWQCVRKLSKCLLSLWQNMRSYILIAEGNISTFNSANWDTLLVGLLMPWLWARPHYWAEHPQPDKPTIYFLRCAGRNWSLEFLTSVEINHLCRDKTLVLPQDLSWRLHLGYLRFTSNHRICFKIKTS